MGGNIKLKQTTFAGTHPALEGVTSDQHHAQLHAASHADAQADELSHNALKDYAANQHRVWEDSIAQDIHNDNISESAVIQHVGAIDHDSLLNTHANPYKLDDLAVPDDNTDLDFSTTKHGLVPKGTNVGDFLKDDGTWAAAGGGGAFTDLTDTPANYVGAEGKFVKVNAVPDALEFTDHNKALHDALNIDADLLDGAHAAVAAGNGTIVQRHASGYIFANYFNTTPNTVTSAVTQVCVEVGNDGYIRHGTAAAIWIFLGLASYLNQAVLTSSKPTFEGLYFSGSSTIQSVGSGANLTLIGGGGTADIQSQTIASRTTVNDGNVYCASGSPYRLKRFTSSVEYKDKIKDLELDSSLIYNLRPRSYNSKCDNDDKDKRFVGLMAEEVEKIYPEIIDYGDEGKVVNYDSRMLMTLMLAEIQYHEARIKALEAQLNN